MLNIIRCYSIPGRERQITFLTNVFSRQGGGAVGNYSLAGMTLIFFSMLYQVSGMFLLVSLGDVGAPY